MDVGQSFQFVVDHLPDDWTLVAPDWRGFGRTEFSGADSYWLPDYLGDLDALLQRVEPNGQHNLVGHSMGGNLVMLYAGVRADRISRVVNLEGMGMPATDPADAPARLANWLDSLHKGHGLRDYDSLQAVADRLCKNNPRLQADKALYLAGYWAARSASGRYELQADPNHKRINPYLYRVDETVACWSQIKAPVLLAVSEHRNERHAFTDTPEYQSRLAQVDQLTRVNVSDAGHMMHHDQPEQVATLISDFFQ